MNKTVDGFAFNETTGDLRTTGPFDYESSKKFFILIFMAFDNGIVKRNATQQLEIAVQVRFHHLSFNSIVQKT